MLSLTVSKTHFRVRSAALCALIAFVGVAESVYAQSPPHLGDMLFPKPNAAAPQALQYRVQGRRFTLDRSFPARPLLRFDDETEVFALTSFYGARGDEFLRTDTGTTLLRITTLGGFTVFGPLGPMGAPADAVGPGRPIPRLRVPPGGSPAVIARAQRALGSLVGAPLKVVLPKRLSPGVSSEVLDRVGDGIRKARAGLGAVKAGRIREVRVVLAAYSGATLRQSVLWIGIAPSLGYAGRPSSDAVHAAILDPTIR